IDGDNIPDVIDDDIDGDGIPNNQDNDIDGDGIPNTQDDDIDGDGIKNIDDNDIDGDGIPNTLDPDIDGDGIPNTQDDDIDGDGIKNIDDNDIDGDGIPNEQDDDIDGDGIPNDQDDDIDGDGIPNDEDIDIDGDGIINAEDDDIDGDGIINESDSTPGGNKTTTTNGTKGTSNTGSDKNTGTTNTGADKNTGSTADDPYVSGVALTVSDTLDYKIHLDAAKYNGTITQSETIQLKDIRDEITQAGVALQSFIIIDAKITATATGSLVQQNASKKAILKVFYTEGNNTKINIIETSPSADFAPFITFNDLVTGLSLNNNLFASSPGFLKFIAILKDQGISSLNVGIEVEFIDELNVSDSDITIKCALKFSGKATL
ncbi:MAG: hypothetical protein GX640_22055, partial [Fibrobacter sp.]|nr:hypothetical protein [Fibrobacter sp.]